MQLQSHALDGHPRRHFRLRQRTARPSCRTCLCIKASGCQLRKEAWFRAVADPTGGIPTSLLYLCLELPVCLLHLWCHSAGLFLCSLGRRESSLKPPSCVANSPARRRPALRQRRSPPPQPSRSPPQLRCVQVGCVLELEGLIVRMRPAKLLADLVQMCGQMDCIFHWPRTLCRRGSIC